MQNRTMAVIRNRSSKPRGGQSFEIMDNPSRGRLMIGPGSGGGATEGFVKNLGMGVANSLVATPPVVYRDAAEQFLRSTGRNCTAQDVTAIMEPRYEVRYQCMGGRTNQDRMLGPDLGPWRDFIK